jgi:hypothetical protein
MKRPNDAFVLVGLHTVVTAMVNVSKQTHVLRSDRSGYCTLQHKVYQIIYILSTLQWMVFLSKAKRRGRGKETPPCVYSERVGSIGRDMWSGRNGGSSMVWRA